MIERLALLSRLRSDKSGAVMIETALVAPVLILLSIGAFQVSTLVARNSELVGAMSEAQSMVLAADLDTAEQRGKLKEVLVESTGVAAEKISVEDAFRCNAAPDYVTAENECVAGDRVSTFIKIGIEDTYTPIWVGFGIGKPFKYDLDRYIMYKQATK